MLGRVNKSKTDGENDQEVKKIHEYSQLHDRFALPTSYLVLSSWLHRHTGWAYVVNSIFFFFWGGDRLMSISCLHP